jgi:PAS domain S-box-containing protein
LTFRVNTDKLVFPDKNIRRRKESTSALRSPKKRKAPVPPHRPKSPRKKIGTNAAGAGRAGKRGPREIKTTLAEIIALAPVSIIVSRAGKTLHVNRKFEETFGLAAGADAIGRPLSDFIAAARRENELQRTMREKPGRPGSPPYEVVGRRAGGPEFPLRAMPLEIRLPDGPATLRVLLDISAQKRAEDALRESEKRFYDLFNSMGEMVVLHEAVEDAAGRVTDYRILDCNAAFTRITGIPQERARGSLASELYETGRAPYLETYAEVLRSGRPTYFETFFPPMNKHFGVSVFTPGPHRFATVTTDISDRKRIEETLEAERSILRTLVDNLPDNVFIKDTRGGILLDNLAHRRLLGRLKPDDVAGKSDRDFFEPALADRYMDDERRIVESGRPLINHEEPTVDSEGRPHWFLTTKVPVRDGQGRITALVGINRDVTERKKIETQIRQSLYEKEILLKEIYHRTKNNMNVIGALLSLKARDCRSEIAAGTFREIEDKIQSMALVHEKLYQSRDLSNIDFREYVNDLAGLLMRSHEISAENLTVVLEIENIAVPIDIAIPCGMILTELFSNVFKHAFPDGRKGEVRIGIGRTAGAGIELAFADDGVGVPEGFDFRAQPTLGMQTIIMLAEHQLQGRAAFERRGGVICRIRFDDAGFAARSES